MGLYTVRAVDTVKLEEDTLAVVDREKLLHKKCTGATYFGHDRFWPTGFPCLATTLFGHGLTDFGHSQLWAFLRVRRGRGGVGAREEGGPRGRRGPVGPKHRKGVGSEGWGPQSWGPEPRKGFGQEGWWPERVWARTQKKRPRRLPPEREERMEFSSGEGKKKREILGGPAEGGPAVRRRAVRRRAVRRRTVRRRTVRRRAVRRRAVQTGGGPLAQIGLATKNRPSHFLDRPSQGGWPKLAQIGST